MLVEGCHWGLNANAGGWVLFGVDVCVCVQMQLGYRESNRKPKRLQEKNWYRGPKKEKKTRKLHRQRTSWKEVCNCEQGNCLLFDSYRAQENSTLCTFLVK